MDGKRYLDGVSSLWVTVHGHRHPVITQAIIEQTQKLAHSTLLGPSHAPAILLAEKMVEISPAGLQKVFYSECGAAAVEIGLKIAFQYWQQRNDPRKRRTKFAHLEHAYHGDTLGAISVGGIELFHEVYRPLITEQITVPSPYCYRCPFSLFPETCCRECFDAMEQTIAAHHEELAAFIIEPLVQGAAGMITAPEGFLKKARQVCDRYGILLIADEVAVGFGKTGRMFACEHEEVLPDIMVTGKGITGGYLALAATLTTDEIYNAFLGRYHEQKTFFHGHTYTGNPIACAAALANFEVFEQEQTLVRLQDKIAAFSTFLNKLPALPHVGDVRRRGVMVGIELVWNKDTKEPFPAETNVARRVIQEARRHGLIIRPLGDVVILMPPLSITVDELQQMVEITGNAIQQVTEVEIASQG